MDDLLPQAIELVIENKAARTSLIQRKLSIGYNRAGRLMDKMEELGVVGPFQGVKDRKVLITSIDKIDIDPMLPTIQQSNNPVILKSKRINN